MELEAVRRELTREIEAALAAQSAAARFRGARHVVASAGIAALQIEYSNGLSLGDVLLRASTAPPTPDRRDFALIVIESLSVDGLIPTTSERSDIDRNICSLAESALAEILSRFKYPFRGQTYEKRRALEGLHASVVELLKPLAPVRGSRSV